jgi:hypothetical protein
MITIDVNTDDTLFDLEEKLARVGKFTVRHNLAVRLARNLRWDFVRESRLAALLATIGRNHDLTVCDWYDKWDDDQIETYFRTSLVGMTALLYSTRVTNLRSAEIPETKEALLQRIAIGGGVLEPRLGGSRGKSITFCAFDPDWSEPAALSGTTNHKELFKRTFGNYRRKYLEIGKGLVRTDVSQKWDDRLEDFIFELYQNTYEHGRGDVDGPSVPGIRYIRIRKYLDQKEHFLSRAKGFLELTEYLQHVIPGHGAFKFYEIAISDHGEGMITRFLRTRPDFAPRPQSESDYVSLINGLLTTPLTSKRDFPGAGYGLPRALRAISLLQGFISLRTQNIWLYGHSAENNGGLVETGLRNVGFAAELGPVAGTHFNILLPVRVG